MKKRLFMIIAIMTIVAMAVVGLVACVDNNGGANNGGSDNGGGNNGGSDNGGGNNGGGGNAQITETAGLNINNFRTELEKKNFTLKSEITRNNGGENKVNSKTLEYEPTKWKETEVINGENSVSYLYQLGDTNIRVEPDLSLSIAANDVLYEVIFVVVPNVGDIYDLTDGIYTVNKDKYEDYYKALYDDDEDVIPDEEYWTLFKILFASLKMQFKENSILLSYSMPSNSGNSESYSFEITKIGNTSVTIPQEILDIPVHGLTIDRLYELNYRSYTANLKNESDGVVKEDRIIKYYHDYNNSSCLSSYLKDSNDMIYIWESENKYYKATQEGESITKEETERAKLHAVTETIEKIVGDDYRCFELKEGKYMVAENEIENYLRSHSDLYTLFLGDTDAINEYIKSIEFTLGKDITLSYTRTIKGVTTKTTLTISDFYTTTTSVPDSIINMPVTNPAI